MNINILQWNIAYQCKSDKMMHLLQGKIEGNSIVCCQEVSKSCKEKLVEWLNPTDYAFSLDFRVPGKLEGRNRKLGLLTMSFGGSIKDTHLLDRSLFPERTLSITAKFGDKEIRVLNFHSLTGSGYKKAKSSQFATIAEYLDENNLDFFCCDANEPKVDSPDSSKLEFWNNGDKGKYASLIFGENKVHELEDSLHSIKEEITELPISYKTSKNSKRYDYIFKSKQWIVESLEYNYDGAIEAYSDHALVIGKYRSV